MKKIYLLIALNSFNAIFSQNAESLRNLPDIIPPSPTVNSLMKFEEVPVSNYTGVPDISIPIVSLPSGMKGVPVSVGLQYHIYNAKPEDKASEVGLGWSLLAGGTISRTVMGSPDEKITSNGLASGVKIGIYLDETTNQHAYKNYFHTIINDPNQATQTVNTNKSIFEAYYKNRFDTQYDLYQYNFFNYTGRFVVKKNGNLLNVVKLDKNNLKIDVIYQATTFEPTSFKITDDKGNIYIFDIVETSNLSTFGSSQDYESTGYVNSTASAVTFNSAFHLSKVQNFDGQNFLLFKYNSPVSIFSSETNEFSTVFSDPNANSTAVQFNKASLPRKKETNTSTITTNVRKLIEIELVGQGKINFDYELGREDTNYMGGDNATKLTKLKNIRVLSNDGRYNEKYNLNYAYREGNYKRLFLTSIDKTYFTNSSYTLDYNHTFDYYPSFNGSVDEWELYQCLPDFGCGILPLPGASIPCGFDMLKSITYPTKGKTEFNYESNTYTYAPQVLDFNKNELNWNNICTEVEFNRFNFTDKKYAFTILKNGTNAKVFNYTGAINSYAWTVRVLRKEGSNYIEVGSSGTAVQQGGSPPPTEFELINLAPGQYYFELTTQTIGINPQFIAQFRTEYREKNDNNLQYLVGAGVRIGSIKYYNQTSTPERTINYDYKDITDSKKSSGALLFPIPVKEYNEVYKALLEYPVNLGQVGTELFQTDILRKSRHNFVQIQKTKGGDIGYQYVTVSETGKGKTVYQYTSPMDHPSLTLPPMLPPFYAVPNNDFERGNILNKKIYDATNTLLNEDVYQYTYNSFNEKTGGTIRTNPHFVVGEYLYGGKYTSYEDFVADNKGVRAYLTPDVQGFLTYYANEEIFGTALLSQQKSIQYYPNNKKTTAITDYIYNSRDYPLKQTVTAADGSIIETNYQYAHEKNKTNLMNANMISLPLETSVLRKHNISDPGKIMAKTETKYDNSSERFPTSEISYDLLTGTSYEELKYTQFDNRANLMKYNNRGNFTTHIFWGYNQTKPIIKVEGSIIRGDYEALLNEIIDLSAKDNNPSAYNLNPEITEANLLVKLDEFRTLYSSSDLRITTYTYDPLVGITTITSPSGIRETHIYNKSNRLEKIVDGNGKVLKEFKYNYKN
ncbi:hypothetical protein D1631_09000 [Chryseobacterium nematophagum]|uniref:RHS repeat protein n=1 Tax=Chryseobacterium nematophagum TaxID=2305228 RepID=A0A3M7TIL5_9FLAO|nr:hypothetical protein [Chryseobacterium nematophagum]RNA62060.1 hypothetical protein D1631_09000 [Chryseobacterium nematophagum]